MRKKILKFINIFLFSIICLALIISCKSSDESKNLIKNTNKLLVYFNYVTKEICLLDIDTGNIERKHKLDLDIKRYQQNRQGYSYYWFYANGDLYLMSSHSQETNIMKINLDTFEINDILSVSNTRRIYIDDEDIYLLKYNGTIQVPKDHYFVKYNLQTKEEINSGNIETLEEDRNNYITNFLIYENNIIFNFAKPQKNILYLYNISTKELNILEEDFAYYWLTYIENKLLYKKTDFILFDLENNNKQIMNLKKNILECYLLGNNLIVYTQEKPSMQTLVNQIFPDYTKITRKYFIADINNKANRMFFQSNNQIEIFGLLDKK